MYSYGFSQKQNEVLTKARGFFELANRHPELQLWRQKAIEDYGFYDGTEQWSQEVLNELAERNQSPITVNKIKNLVNYLAGMEIQTRFRVAFRSHSGKVEDDRLAKAITHLGYAIQENQDIPYKASLKFRDALITGIGWSNIYKDPATGEIKYEHVNPLNVLYDPDDLEDDFANMTFVARVRWIPLYKAEELWPQHKAYFRAYFSATSNAGSGSYSGEIQAREQNFIDLYASGTGNTGSRIMVVEVQYREQKKSFQGIDYQGNFFETFDEDEAKALSGDGELKKTTATSIMRVLFTGDCLLEYAPLNPQLPNLKDFTYIPCVLSRIFKGGKPDGFVSDLKDIQREINYRRAKLVNNLNSFSAVIDFDALPTGMTAQQIRNELKRPDSVIVKPSGSEFTIQSNQALASGQFEMLARSDSEMQQVSGIYDEALGKETNAESGIAIQKRQVNSVKNQIFYFERLRMMKKREARMMLDLIQGGGDQFIEAHILTPEEEETVLLNVVREVNGQKIILNDIRTLPLSIFVEEVPDYESSLQEQQANIQAILNSANPELILRSPNLLKRLGIRDWEQIPKEIEEIFATQAQQEAMAKEQAMAINNRSQQPSGEQQ